MTVTTGRCWRLGDNISNDQLMSSKWVFDYDLKILTRNILADVIPEFADQARPGDFIVAGENLAHGSLHIHPFLALKEMGVGVICKSMPRGSFRLAIYAGVNVLIDAGGVHDLVEEGDQIEVDEAGGIVRNLTRAGSATIEPLSPFLAEIISAGGGIGYMKKMHQESA